MKDFLTTTQTHPPQIPLPYYLLMLLAMVLLSYLSWLCPLYLVPLAGLSTLH